MVYCTYKYILPDLFGLSSSINCLASEGKWQNCLACRGRDFKLNQGLEQKIQMNNKLWGAQTKKILIHKYQKACVCLEQRTNLRSGWMGKKGRVILSLWKNKNKKSILVKHSGKMFNKPHSVMNLSNWDVVCFKQGSKSERTPRPSIISIVSLISWKNSAVS